MELNKIFLDLIKNINDQLSSSLPSLFLYTGYNKIESKVPVVVLEYKENSTDRFTDLKGFELIYKLRATQKYKGSIVVLSLFSKDKVKEFQYPKKNLYPVKLIETSNVEFFCVNSFGEDNIDNLSKNILNFLKQRIELSELVREDMVNLCINPKYIIEDKIHDLKSLFKGDKLEIKEINQFKNEIIPSIKVENLNKAENCIEEFKKRLEVNYIKQLKECLLVLAKEPSLENGFEDKNEEVEWEVLYIDDQEDARNIIRKLFEDINKGIKCHLAKDYIEADNILDGNTKISWIISDYRLKRDKRLEHYQGFDLLLKLEKEYELIRKFKKTILTGKNSIIQHSARYFNKIDWYSKDVVFKDEVYFKHLVSFCTPEINHFYQLSLEPINFKDEGWLDSYENKDYDMGENFKYFYVKLKHSLAKDWYEFNELINKRAISVIFDKKGVINSKLLIVKVITTNKPRSSITENKVNNFSKFKSVMENRLLLRRLETGYRIAKNDSLIDGINDDSKRSTIRRLHAINKGSFENLNNSKAPLTIEEKEFVKEIESHL